MRRGRHAGRAGFALLPVVLALALLGATAYLMTRESASGVALVASAQQTDRARYLAEAALRHATWQAHTAGCDGYSDVASTAFGADSYSATVTPTSGSPITVAATGTLADGTIHTLTRAGERVYETPTNVVLQLSSPDAGKDSILDSFYAARNCGGASYLQVNSAADWTQRVLIQFDLSSLPAGVEVISARLELKQWNVNVPGRVSVHRLTRDWAEGTKVCGGTADGANWPTFDGTQAWSVPGGDFDPAPASEAYVTNATNNQWMGWEVGGLVEGWLADPTSNHGMLLREDGVVREAKFASREASNPNDAPRLTIVYACECGKTCGGVASGQNLLLVVSDASSLSSKESAGIALMESWGYTVTTINATASEADYDTALADVDVVYISGSISSNDLGTKLTAATVGVLSEDAGLVDELGIAEPLFIQRNTQFIEIIDNTHYVTSDLSIGDLEIFSSSQDVWTVSGTLAPGLQLLAETKVGGTGFPPGVAVLETGAALYGGGFAAGRRVQVPWSIGSAFDYNVLNADGLDIMKRAVEWAGGAGCDSSKPLLLVVNDADNPTVQEAARQTLIESWCYSVTLIDDDADSGELAAAMALSDVIYISPEITTLTTVSKLKDANIGIVNEDPGLHPVFGFSSIRFQGTTNAPLNTDSAHYITSPFGGGAVTLFTSDQPCGAAVGTLPAGLETIGTWSSGTLSSLGGLLTLESGAAISGGGTAAGRRVQMPWDGVDGVSVADIGALMADGQTIIQRALEWAAGAGCGSMQNVLLVVGDDTLPLASKDAGRVELIESGCFTVSVIDDGDTQANFDAAAAAADVVYVSGTVGGGTLLDKLTGTTTGLVNEFAGKLDNFGFSSSTTSTVNTDTFSNTNPVHYITEPFSGNPVTVFSTSLSMPVPGGTLAPDLSNVGEVTGTLALVTLDANAQRYDGTPAPARRVHLPFASAETTELTADGETIMQRALEWGAGAGTGGGGGGSCDGTFRDEFNAQVWSGSDGTLAWATDWVELGEGGTPTGGDIMVFDDMGPYSARIRDNGTSGAGAGIRREADLSAYATATLSFDFRRDGPDDADDYVTADVSDDGGATWTELDRFAGEGQGTEDPIYQSRSYDITDYRAPNTRIRFLSSPGFGNVDVVYFDNVEICVGE